MTTEAECLVINAFSPPRCLSTALMYSFAQRSDCEVHDEPLYGAWLRANSHLERPYRGEVLREQPEDAAAVLGGLQSAGARGGKRVRYVKHIVKQFLRPALVEGGKQHVLASNVVNVLLVRDPVLQISSWADGCAGVTMEELCWPETVQLYSLLRDAGKPPVVVDAVELQRHPRRVLTALCERVGLEFDESMLQWEAGPKPYDGCWASEWYRSVHASSGFSPPSYGRQLPPSLYPLAEECSPFFAVLRRHAIMGTAAAAMAQRDGAAYTPVLLPHRNGSGEVVHADAAGAGGEATESTPAATVSDHGLELSLIPNERNRHLLVWVGDRLYPRSAARLSPFDSTVQGGDAVWEGIRVYSGRVFQLEAKIRRLLRSAKAMDFKEVPSPEVIKYAIFCTLRANGMYTDTHMRVTLSRGEKSTSSMNPRFNAYGCNFVVLAEWKQPGGATTYDNTRGVKLITASQRRNGPHCVDSKIHHCNLINNILPKIQANQAGAEDAVMLDPEGFVSETNATNIFIVRDGVLATSHGEFCLPGITRGLVIELAHQLGIECQERRISLMELHTAEEVFVTGTMGELTPVVEVDGRRVGDAMMPESSYTEGAGPVTTRLQAAYRSLTECEGEPLPFPNPFSSSSA